MNDGARLADRVRDKIAKGLLPRDRPDKIGTGHGAGEPCAACEEPIQAAQIEYRAGEFLTSPAQMTLGGPLDPL
jgi:hypothetical protein